MPIRFGLLGLGRSPPRSAVPGRLRLGVLLILRGMRNRRKTPVLSEEIEVTTIPAEVLPGGPLAEQWQNAYADYLEADSDEALGSAIGRMEALGMRNVTGHIETSGD